MRQYKPLSGMRHLSNQNDEPIILPDSWHYLLALWVSSRCFDFDERFYEATEKRDEFENAFAQFRADVECGTITLVDGDGNPIDLSTDGECIIDHVKDVYFKNYERDEDVIEVLECIFLMIERGVKVIPHQEAKVCLLLTSSLAVLTTLNLILL